MIDNEPSLALNPLFYSHTAQFKKAELTDGDYRQLSHTHLDEIILDSSAEGTQHIPLGQAIALSRRSLEILLRDRERRKTAHQMVTDNFAIEPTPKHFFTERDSYSEAINSLISEFCENALSTDITSCEGIGLELGHQEHVGEIFEEKITALNNLYLVAEQGLIKAALNAGGRLERAQRGAFIVIEEGLIDDESPIRIHKKMPEWDIVFDSSAKRRIEVYTRETYAGLSKPGLESDGRLRTAAIQECLQAESPRQTVTCGTEGWVVPVSTTLIIRTRHQE